ncbi:quercetin 2,3-dioxygenase [Trujillonella humicola]|uniref:quercetin 2,3-dioxygenase n=1 Tax=Trujillonella humicola TaxID=3383699 RepID=UPI00390631E4
MSTDPAGYVLRPGAGPTRWFLDTRMTVKTGGAATGGALTVIEWSAPVGFGPPRHVHHAEDEMFYVLDGEMVIECGDQRWTARPGDFAFLPHGVAHVFVVSRGPVRGLQLTTPAGFEAFVEEVGRVPEGPGLPPPSVPDVAELVEAGRRHGNDVVGPPLSLDECGVGD